MLRLTLSVALFAGLILATAANAQKLPDQRIDHKPGFPEISALGIEIASSGEAVYATWFDGRFDPALVPNTDIWLNRSTDSGRSWQNFDTQIDTGEPPGTSRSMFPKVAADGDAVYVVWAELRSGGSEVFFNRSLDQGKTWLAAPFAVDASPPSILAAASNPQIAVSGSTIHVVWEDRRDGPSEDIYYNRSTDNGSTWMPAATRIDLGDVPGDAVSSGPSLVVDGSFVYVVWSDLRGSPANPFQQRPDIYFNGSSDAGISWAGAAVQLDTDGVASSTSFDAKVGASGSSVYVIWLDLRPGPSADVYFNRSLDAGASWLASDIRIDVGDLPAGSQSLDASLAAQGSSVYIAWQDHRNGDGDVYFNRSLDSGGSWLNLPLRLDLGDPPGASGVAEPTIAAEGSRVFVAWNDYRHPAPPLGSSDIMVNRSLDSGSSWLAQEIRVNTGTPVGDGAALNPSLAISNGSLHVVWGDSRFYNKGETDVFYNLALGAQRYGSGVVGSGGNLPELFSTGFAMAGGNSTVEINKGLGGTFGLLFVGLNGEAAIPALGGIFLVQLPALEFSIVLNGALPGSGWLSIPVAWPTDVSLIGLAFNLQALFADPGVVPGGVSMTRGLELWIG